MHPVADYRITNSLAILAASSLFISGCGDDLSCGPGTENDGGECVLAEGGEQATPTPQTPALSCGEGTVEVDGSCLPAEVEPSLGCGAGTMALDGSCVPDPATTAWRPQVDSVTVKRLTVDGDPGPFHMLFPITVSASFDIVGDAFSSSVVVGLESGDGEKGCILGVLEVERSATEDEIETVQSSAELTMQPSCEVLVGSDDVRVFLAFDPFEEVTLAGRDAGTTQTDDVFDFVRRYRLDLDECTPGEGSEHEDTCETALEVLAAPGRDVELMEFELSSSVAVLHIGVEQEEISAEQMRQRHIDAGLELSDDDVITGADAYKTPTPEVPHFSAGTAMRVLGLGPDDEVEAGDISLRFAIRPKSGAAGTERLSDEEMAWQPLHTELQIEGRAGEEPTTEYLLEDYLSDLVGPAPVHKASPVYITGDTAALMGAAGAWGDVRQFDLQVCVEAEFDEAEIGQGENNCGTLEVVVLRDLWLPGGAGKSSTASEAGQFGTGEQLSGWSDSKNAWELSFSTAMWLSRGYNKQGSSLSIGPYGFTSVPNKASWFEGGLYAGLTVFGANLTIVYLVGNAVHNVDFDDYASLRFNILGDDKIPYTEKRLLEATYSLSALFPGISTTWSWDKVVAGKKKSFLGCKVNASVSVSLSAGLNADDTAFTVQALTSRPNPCSGRPVNDRFCIKESPPTLRGVWHSWDTAVTECQADGGFLTQVRSSADWDEVRRVIPLTRNANYIEGFPYIGIGSTDYYYGVPGLGENRIHLDGFERTPTRDGTLKVLTTALTSNGQHLVDARPWGTTANMSTCMYRDLGGNTLGGVKLSAVVVPFVNASLSGEASLDTSFLSANLNGTLLLAEIRVPATGYVSVETSPAVGIFRAGAGLDVELEFLSGEINFNWKLLGLISGSWKIFDWTGFQLGWAIIPETGTTRYWTY